MHVAEEVLASVPDDPGLRAAMAARQEHLQQNGAGPWYVTTSAAELVLAHRLAAGDTTLTPYQLQLAQEQHLCRTTHNAAHACMRLVTVRETCSETCPIAQLRVEQLRANQRRDHAFVTDWYMPEAHALIDPGVQLPERQ